MTFVYDKSLGIAREPETGTEIASKSGFRDGEYTFTYKFTQGDVQFDFEIIPSSLEYTHYTSVDSKITGLPKGSPVVGVVQDAVYVIEEAFSNGLSLGMRKAGKDKFSESEYEYFKNVIRAGLTALFTQNGETLKNIPDGKFQVEFEKSVAALAAKYPGKIRGYSPILKKNS